MIATTCPCGESFYIESEDLGQVVECPECGAEIAVLDAPFLEKARRVCPVCESRNWTKITRRRAFKKKMPAQKQHEDADEMHTEFFFSLPRECQECGSIWLPPAPAWAMIFCMLLGTFLAGGAIIEFCELLPPRPGVKLPNSVLAAGAAGGLALIGYGMQYFRGKTGGAKLLKIGGSRD